MLNLIVEGMLNDIVSINGTQVILNVGAVLPDAIQNFYDEIYAGDDWSHNFDEIDFPNKLQAFDSAVTELMSNFFSEEANDAVEIAYDTMRIVLLNADANINNINVDMPNNSFKCIVELDVDEDDLLDSMISSTDFDFKAAFEEAGIECNL